ncbi:MAG: methyl-accepting chemotaxis protein [Gammaproteobacteria bacterium]|nr:methyl-accepting chemotaxis protein [Gammaproteobacteria bacterium]MDH5591461.1 methyl-accepting chemotaxis protein [Gammaproteobacteria bacterium]
MKLKQKITIAAVVLCVVPMLALAIVSNWIASNQSHAALESSAEARLISLRDVKKTQIEDYFATIRNQLLNFAAADAVISATKNFATAYERYASETGQTDRTSSVNKLTGYYNNTFMPEYLSLNPGASALPTSNLLAKIDLNGLSLQNTLIAKNPAPLGEKDSMTDLGDGSQYSYWHNQYHPYLRDVLQRFGFYDIFLVDSTTGKVVYSVYKELDFATSLMDGPYANSGLAKAFKEANKATRSGVVAITDFESYTPSYEGAAAFMATPIFENGVKRGVLIFQMPVSRINHIMTFDGKWSEAGLGNSGEIYLVGADKRSRSESRFLMEDKSGYIDALRASPTISNEIVDTITAKGTALGLQPVDSRGSQAALAGNSGFDIFSDYRGVAVLSAYAPLAIEGLNWVILAEIDKEEAFAAADDLSNHLWLYGFIILAIMAALAAVIAAQLAGLLSKPIVAFSNFISQVSEQLDLTRRLDINRTDEIGDAGNAFNKLLDVFQKGMHEVTDASSRIAAASEETSVITEQTSEAIQTQQAEISHVATAMNEMSATVNDIAKNTTQTAVASDTARENVQAGTEAMNKTIDYVGAVSTVMQQASETIAQLEQRSVDISGVLDVISGIAEQTNLLALNAAIEAARAGEQGRGFAVVADEVRNLASRTQESTGEITKMIEELQNGSKQAVAAMEQSKSQVDAAVEQAGETGGTLATIAEVIMQINDMSSQIATAAEEQGAVSEEINRNVVRINDMTEQTAEGAGQTSQASQDLSRLASDLALLVQKFQV